MSRGLPEPERLAVVRTGKDGTCTPVATVRMLVVSFVLVVGISNALTLVVGWVGWQVHSSHPHVGAMTADQYHRLQLERDRRYEAELNAVEKQLEMVNKRLERIEKKLDNQP